METEDKYKEEEKLFVTIEIDDNYKMDFIVDEVIEIGGKRYTILVSEDRYIDGDVDQPDLIMRINEDQGEEFLEEINDEEELQMVAKYIGADVINEKYRDYVITERQLRIIEDELFNIKDLVSSLEDSDIKFSIEKSVDRLIESMFDGG